ncbi:MAG TPA: DNA replication/repair protein RecF [Patescibacteria group bacterium]|nr:DNA replication/repair protein RecF [Patescibacteria group bacterium]
MGLLESIQLRDLRGYAQLDADFGPGPQLVWGPNAAGKTSLLEAIVLLAWGRSHRTSTDAELIRWGADLARVEGHVAPIVPGPSADPISVEVALVRDGAGGQRKRIRVNGVARRATALSGVLRTVMFAPEDMLLVAGSPGPRRATIDTLAASRAPAFGADLATYGRALQQRNGLLRAIREGEAGRDELRYWDAILIESGSAVVEGRLATLEATAEPLRRAHAEIAPDEGRLTIRYETNAPRRPGETVRDALTLRLAETAEKEAWNGSTLVGPHRDDLVFELEGRDLAGFASRGQQRTAILAVKLAELEVLTALDGRPPLLLLDDVFSELDPERRAHLVRTIAELPQAFVTTTTLDDLDPALRAAGASWAVEAGSDGATLVGPGARAGVG